MTYALPHQTITTNTDKPHDLSRIIWSRRDYHAQLNLRRLIRCPQVVQPLSHITPERKDVTCDQN